jgi:hypothetical protein
MRNIRPIYYKVVKFNLVLATVGAQSFFIYNVYIWSPGQTTSVAAGTVTQATLANAEFTALATCFTYYRVKRILLTFISNISTTVSFPRIATCMQPNKSPTTVGITAAAGTISTVPNAYCIDPHVSASAGYFIPKISDYAKTSAVLSNDLQGGWISTADTAITRNNADPGVITVASSDGVLTAPVTTTAGNLEIDYFLEFKLGE